VGAIGCGAIEEDSSDCGKESMTQPGYTLSWILPFVREALKTAGNFQYRNYANNLWTVMERANVPGIERPPQPNSMQQLFLHDQIPHALRLVTTEAFFYLFHNGYITPAPPD
jgi:hypothetical protein